ncbi:MAG: type II toxin-antitoxin system prevent-host-death family antitoxin [Propionibacteriaceae bacterium]|nr:type II toxin-antitoxin system prevent-host-death family antitoxin [Propionibacteriaceae bacterium]
MAIVNVLEAKTHFSKLLARAEQGEEIIVARAGKPVVRLVPIEELPPRQFGFMDLGDHEIPDSAFFDPLPDEELALWE